LDPIMTQPVASATVRHMLNATLAALTLDPAREVEDLKTEREAATAELADLQPRNATEALLASRIVVAHHAAIECFRRAARPGVSDVVAMRLLTCAASMSRLSMQTTRALEQRKAPERGARPGGPQQAVAAARGQDPVSREPGPGARHPGAGQPGPGGAAVRAAGWQDPMHQSAAGVVPAAGSHPEGRAAAGAARSVMTQQELVALAERGGFSTSRR
jgi:hypothetical protein